MGSLAITSAEEFGNEFIRALEGGVAGAWRERWWTVDLLIVYGVQALSDTERAQDEIARRLKELVATTGPRAPGVSLEMTPISWVRPMPLSEEVTANLEAIAEQVEVESLRMVSMAGHDAMSVARVAPAGLFFIPSLKGISRPLSPS